MGPKHNADVIPIRGSILARNGDRQVVDLAYNIWLASAFRGISPEAALLTAIGELRTRPPLFLVPRRKSRWAQP